MVRLVNTDSVNVVKEFTVPLDQGLVSSDDNVRISLGLFSFSMHHLQVVVQLAVVVLFPVFVSLKNEISVGHYHQEFTRFLAVVQVPKDHKDDQSLSSRSCDLTDGSTVLEYRNAGINLVVSRFDLGMVGEEIVYPLTKVSLVKIRVYDLFYSRQFQLKVVSSAHCAELVPKTHRKAVVLVDERDVAVPHTSFYQWMEPPVSDPFVKGVLDLFDLQLCVVY